MQTMLGAAGAIGLLTGIAHSILGERLIFRHLRASGIVPTLGAPPLRERHIRILWATWHLATVFGCASAVLLLQLSAQGVNGAQDVLVVRGIALAHLGGSVLVLVATKSRHPGWIALLAVAGLAWFGARGG